MLSRRIVQSRTSNLDLDAPGCLGNVDRLDTHLTVDDVRFAPCAYMVAQDINVGTGEWASRHDASKILSVAGAGANPTYGNATAIENTAVKYAAAKYHLAGDATWGQITTGDTCWEIVFTFSSGLTGLLYSRQNTVSTLGYWIYCASSQVYFGVGDGTTYVITGNGVPLVDGSIVVAQAFMDRSDGLYVYVNGIYAAKSASLAAISGSLATAGGWSVGAYPDGAYPFDRNIISVAVWDLPTNPFPGALKNRTYFDRIARERFAIVAGIQDRRQGAHTFTRATPAYLDKYTTHTSTTRWLHRVSSGWPRVCERDDANSKRVRRYLAEPQITNLATNSEDLATTWTAENLTTINSNGAVAPNGETTADGIVANATDTTHGIYGAYTLPATNHCFSAFVKVGDTGWVELYSSIANVSCYFHVAFGNIGTAGAAVTAAGIDNKPYGGTTGYYRCWICFTGSADAKNYGVRAASADGDNTFAGDTITNNLWVWGIQIEATAEYFPSSYIPTAAAAVARNKDELSYNVRLPIVRNIDDLPQALNIGGTDYDPCAYLVAGDCQPDGTWISRTDVHNNVLIDGDMETAGTGAWGVFVAATLSKEVASPQAGSQNLKVLYNGNVSCYAKQSVLKAGASYHITGYARSDGSMTPLIGTDATTVWVGTTSTSWQSFDFNFTNVSGTTLYIGGGAAAGQFTEWDSITITNNAANTLTFTGTGTNPTPQWDAVSRANKTIRYWVSNYHRAPDATFGELTDKDYAAEFLIRVPDAGNQYIASTTDNAGTVRGFMAGVLANRFYWYHVQTGSNIPLITGVGSIPAGQLCHVLVCGDRSEKVYIFINGIFSVSVDISGATETLNNSVALRVGAYLGAAYYGGEIAMLNLYDLPDNPWPGAATNQTVMGAIARARFDQLFQPIAMRLDCEILHPNVNRQTKISLVDISINQLDYNSLMLDTDDYGLAQAAYNNTWAWNSSTTKGSTDLCDNVSRKLSIAARENNARYKENNTTIASDTSCEVPTAHTTLRVGMWADNNFQPSCLVGGVKLWRSDK